MILMIKKSSCRTSGVMRTLAPRLARNNHCKSTSEQSFSLTVVRTRFEMCAYDFYDFYDFD